MLKQSNLSPSLGAAELCHAITIQSPVYAADARGQSLAPSGWATARTCMAAIYTAGGKETSMAAQIVSQVSHVIKARWTATLIRANYRVLWGSRIFTVQFVENVLERNRVLLLYCLEVDTGGGG